mgnify:CR=1 FL=1
MNAGPIRFLAALCMSLVVQGCSGDGGLEELIFDTPETAVSYEVSLNGMPDEAMTELATESLASYRQQENGAQSVAFLRRRADNDIATLRKILRSRGHYKSEIEVKVTPPPEETPDAPATVVFDVDPGPAFILERHDLVLDDPSGTAPPLDAQALGSPVGEAAAAAVQPLRRRHCRVEPARQPHAVQQVLQLEVGVVHRQLAPRRLRDGLPVAVLDGRLGQLLQQRQPLRRLLRLHLLRFQHHQRLQQPFHHWLLQQPLLCQLLQQLQGDPLQVEQLAHIAHVVLLERVDLVLQELLLPCLGEESAQDGDEEESLEERLERAWPAVLMRVAARMQGQMHV